MNDERLRELLAPVTDAFEQALLAAVREKLETALASAVDGMRVATGEAEEEEEPPRKRIKRGPQTCKRCHVVGHNRRSCTEPPAAWETDSAETEDEVGDGDLADVEAAISKEEDDATAQRADHGGGMAGHDDDGDDEETEEPAPKVAPPQLRRDRFAEIQARATARRGE